MTHTVVGFLGLLALMAALQAEDKPETPTPAQQYQALDKEYRKAIEDYRKAMSDAKTREEQKKVFQEKDPKPDKFAPRFLELAEKYPKDPAAVDALIWLATHYTEHRDSQSPRSKALQVLLRDHVQNEKMTALYPALGHYELGYAGDKESQQLLHAVLEKNKHRLAQALACLALADQAEGCLRAARELKDDPERGRKKWETWLSPEVVHALAKSDPDKLSKEGETLYERVIKDFTDLTDARGNKLSEMAKEKLDALRQSILVVLDKPAPEIEAEDIDGKKFKLSDYRGKVVLLDFWGHW
ncbi:MAG TPA: hypothetical protein VH592_07315 [Gemmataceae bacterium]